MEYMNVVRMRIKPGKLETWKARTKESMAEMRKAEDLLDACVIQTGDNEVCYVARWKSEQALAAARPKMIASLDSVRELLEPQGEKGLTDPVSGPVIFSL